MAYKNKRLLQGKVVSKMKKTLVVLVNVKKYHPIYKKSIVVSKKYHVHNPNDLADINDVVQIKEHRPMSALKRFIFVGIKTLHTKSENTKIKDEDNEKKPTTLSDSKSKDDKVKLPEKENK